MPATQTRVTESSAERALAVIAAGFEKMIEAQGAQKAVSASSLYANYGHGPGLFTTPMDPNLVNAMQLPLAGLEARLPKLPTSEITPLYGIITGQTEGSSTTPVTDHCSPWGTAGFTKLCRQYAVLGDQGVNSASIDLNRMGRLVDRADFTDYRLVGDPFMNTDSTHRITPMPGQGDSSAFLNNELAKIMRELEVEAIRRFALDFYTSVPGTAADAYHLAWYRGLNLQVNTGYQDAVNFANGGGGGATRCEKADSVIIPFNTVSITGNNISTNAVAASLMVELIATMVYNFGRIDVESGNDPVVRSLVMAPEAFRALSGVWPCSYLTNNCLTASASNPQFVDATEQVRMREEMRAGSFLWVDGKRIDVIQDTTITQTQGAGAAGAGTFTSDIYYVPFTIRGGFPVLFKTYFNYNGPNAAQDTIRQMGPLLFGSSTSPNGEYLFSVDKSYDCFTIKASTRPGLVLRTPYLAARITNMAYTTRMMVPSWNPNAPSFYLNGGVTTGTGPSYWSPTVTG